MINRLMFEGHGYQDTLGGRIVGNDKIRAALHSDRGKPYFIDLVGHTITKFTTPYLRKYGKVVGIIENSHFIDANGEANLHQIINIKDDRRYFEWSIQGIKKVLADYFDTTVKEIEISNAGYYRAFTSDGYNYGDREG